jgi:7-carboxy-7-deazaguanine synthase
MIYPIAETFNSLQGEGVFTGTPMLFVRLAGCNVGEFGATAPGDVTPGDFPLYEKHEHSICTSVSGAKFLCDTDYRVHERKSEADLVNLLRGEEHVCITGGEPFLHNLTPLVRAFQVVGVVVHIETSGTLPIRFPEDPDPDFPTNGVIDHEQLWITCSPKKGLKAEELLKVQEIKFLVSPNTNTEAVQRIVDLAEEYGQPELVTNIFLQPINEVHLCREDSLDRCLDLLCEFPSLRLSAQLHKYLKQR